MGYRSIGVIGLTGDEEFIGEEEYLGENDIEGLMQQETYGATYQPKPGRVKFQVPKATASALARAKGEVFDIFPGYPNTNTSTNLSVNVADTDSDVHTFTCPTGMVAVLNPADSRLEVLFETFTSAGRLSSDYIPGLISVFAQSALHGSRERVFAGNSTYHNPFNNTASVGTARRWRIGYLVSPGDTLITQVRLASIIGTATNRAQLDHKILAKRLVP